MDYHQKARLTVQSREALAQKVILAGWTLNSAAAEFNVSPKTAAKWVCRYRSEGRKGLVDRSSRPHRSPTRTAAELTLQVEQLRRQRWTAFRIARHTGLSRATVSRILRRLGLNRWRALDPARPYSAMNAPVPAISSTSISRSWPASCVPATATSCASPSRR